MTLPDSVELISSFAFSGCTSLDSITILNKEARIIYNDTIPEYTTIKGYKGSTAEAYAQKYGNKFVALCEHTYKTTTTAKATTKKNGSKVTKCSVCGAKKSSSTIYAIKTVSLSKTSYVYNGKAQKPTVTVKDSKGKKIAASNYIVKYSSNKNVGKATVTITFKGNYSGTVKKTFTIKPKATTLSSVSAKSKGFTAKWKKLTTQTTGYQIQYSTNSKFSSAKTTTVSKNKTTSKTVSKLKAKKKYYIRVRTYKTVKVNGKSTKIYSSWSK
ncbi:MAG: fibronectin type III domain-containing protein, partial [Eubacterium sp.]|nr:fibronectin type III domain-containing protein [Eubacterium sp.]